MERHYSRLEALSDCGSTLAKPACWLDRASKVPMAPSKVPKAPRKCFSSILRVLTSPCILLLSLAALPSRADDNPPLDSARLLSQQARSHSSANWYGEFLGVFLGANHRDSVPSFSSTLEEIGRARTDADITRALSSHGGDQKILAEVLQLAAEEAGVYRPGRVLRQETLESLKEALRRLPVSERPQAYRVEPYEAPRNLADWLHAEQKLNEKIVARSDASSLASGTLPAELDPMRSPVYWLGYVEVPVEDATVVRALSVDSGTERQLLVDRDGKKFVRFFVHPASEAYYSKRVRGCPIRYEFLASPTASPRSLAVWNPHRGDPPMLIKTSLDASVGDLRRMIPREKLSRAVAVTNSMDQWYAENRGGRAPPFLRESMTVVPPGSSNGMIVRELPPGFPQGRGTRFVPALALYGRPPGGGPPMLVEMIQKSGMQPMDYVREKVFRPLLSTYADMTYGQGLVGEPHQQNVVYEIGRDGQLTGRVLIRDLDSMHIDPELRIRKGLSLEPFLNEQKPSKTFKFGAGQKYYETSYESYIRSDLGYMTQRVLSAHFPGMTRPAVYRAMDRVLAEEIRRHLGVEADLSKPLNPNEAVREFKRQAAAEPASAAELRVSQKILAEEFNRLEFNRRIVRLKGPIDPTKPVEYLLHKGAIEARQGGSPRALAVLEPPEARNFYQGVPYPRREPAPRRLKLLYGENAPRAVQAQSRALSAARGILGDQRGFILLPGLPLEGSRPNQQAGFARIASTIRTSTASFAEGFRGFGVAYLVKEGLNAAVDLISSGRFDGSRFRNMATPEFAVHFGATFAAFSATAAAAHTGLKAALTRLAPTVAPRILGGTLGKWAPVAAGMAAVEFLTTGKLNVPRFLVGVGTFMAASLIVDAVLVALGPPGWVALAAKWGITLGVSMFFGEKLEQGLEKLWGRLTRKGGRAEEQPENPVAPPPSGASSLSARGGMVQALEEVSRRIAQPGQ